MAYTGKTRIHVHHKVCVSVLRNSCHKTFFSAVNIYRLALQMVSQMQAGLCVKSPLLTAVVEVSVKYRPYTYVILHYKFATFAEVAARYLQASGLSKVHRRRDAYTYSTAKHSS